MAEPPIKKRILTKVRRQFLNKTPDDDDEAQNHANLPATPEELNDGAAYLLEPAYGLVEKSRTIQAGHQFLNGSYKVGSVRIEQQARGRAVTLDLQSNHVDTLPWEYSAKRLESFGNLELATWANRIKHFHKVYPQQFEEYSKFINSDDPNAQLALMQGKVDAELARQEAEAQHAYLRFVLYAGRDSVVPVSVSYSEGFLKPIGYDSIEDFIDWIKENGMPALFKGESDFSLGINKLYLTGPENERSMCEAGAVYPTLIYDKEEVQQKAEIQLYFAKEPRPEGFYVYVYMVRKDLNKNCPVLNQNKEEEANNNAGEEDENMLKIVRKDNPENQEKETPEDLEKGITFP